MKNLTKIILSTIGILTVIIIAGLLFLTSTYGEKYVKRYLEDTLTAQLGTQVEIGFFETDFWSHVQMNQLSVANSQASVLYGFL